MNDVVKTILKILGLLIGYPILTIIIFYITGMYIWTTPPTKLVLRRMVVFPIFLTTTTVAIAYIVKKINKQNKKITDN